MSDSWGTPDQGLQTPGPQTQDQSSSTSPYADAYAQALLEKFGPDAYQTLQVPPEPAPKQNGMANRRRKLTIAGLVLVPVIAAASIWFAVGHGHSTGSTAAVDPGCSAYLSDFSALGPQMQADLTSGAGTPGADDPLLVDMKKAEGDLNQSAGVAVNPAVMNALLVYSTDMGATIYSTELALSMESGGPQPTMPQSTVIGTGNPTEDATDVAQLCNAH